MRDSAEGGAVMARRNFMFGGAAVLAEKFAAFAHPLLDASGTNGEGAAVGVDAFADRLRGHGD